jgi:nucleoside-diphosphate-sugar epimerase
MDSAGGQGTILFGGSGFLGPYILRANPAMISVGRTSPPVANRHIAVPSLDDLRALDEVPFDRVIFIVGNTDHHAMERETIPRGEPNAFDYHVTPLIQTLEQLKQRRIERFMLFSSVLVYDETKTLPPVSETAPIDPYRNRYVMSKYLGEELARFYSNWVPIITVRMANLYGPTPLERFDLIHVLSRKLLRDGRAEVWSRRPKRDFIYVEDAAKAVVQLLHTSFTGLVNLGTGIMTPVGEVVDILQEISGYPIHDRDIAVQGPMEFQVDTSTLFRLIEWRPQVSVREGVRRTYLAMKAHLTGVAAS